MTKDEKTYLKKYIKLAQADPCNETYWIEEGSCDKDKKLRKAIQEQVAAELGYVFCNTEKVKFK